MKKLISISIALSLIFYLTLSGCSGNGANNSASAPVSISMQTQSIFAGNIPLSELSFGDVTEEEFGRMCLPIFKGMYLEIFGIDVENPPYGEFYATTLSRNDINDLTLNPSGDFYHVQIGYYSEIPYMSEKELEEKNNEDSSRMAEISPSIPFESQYYEYEGEPIRETGIPYSKYPAVYVGFAILENIEDGKELRNMEGIPYTTEFVFGNLFIFIASDESEKITVIEDYVFKEVANTRT